jgi:hypothetical protein
MWSLSNICAGPVAHCMEILKHKIMNKIIYCFGNEEYRVRKESCHIIDQMLDKNNDEITDLLLSFDVDGMVIRILNEIEDHEFLKISLSNLNHLLSIGRNRLEKFNDGSILDRLDKLDTGDIIGNIANNHPAENIRSLCNDMLQNHYN